MLFVVMLGGKHPRAKIEVHDVVFAIADSLEATYPQLRQGWFGSPAGLGSVASFPYGRCLATLVLWQILHVFTYSFTSVTMLSQK